MTRPVLASLCSRAALALLSSAVACTEPPAATSPDLAPTPTSDLLAQPLLAVVGSDFASGALSTVDPSSRAVRKNLDVVDAQPVARAFGSKLYVLDQTHGALRIYDATKDFKNPLDVPVSKAGMVDGAQANPHDIYIDAPRQLAYVSLYGSLGSTQVTASRALGVIDLNAPAAGLTRFIALTQTAADTDGNPEAEEDVMAAIARRHEIIKNDRKRLVVPAEAAAVAKLAPSYHNESLGDLTVIRSGPQTVLDVGEWKSAVASRKNDDGTYSLITTEPGSDSVEFVVGEREGKRVLMTRDAQHEYPFVEQ